VIIGWEVVSGVRTKFVIFPREVRLSSDKFGGGGGDVRSKNSDNVGCFGEVGSHSDKTPKPLIHLPSNLFLAMLTAGGTKVFSNYVEIGLMAYNIFGDLMAEKSRCARS
jgi:hypothetical protein